MFLKIKEIIVVRPYAVLVTATFLVCCIHLLTVREYPSAWFDEIEILEMGRFSMFDVKPDWSVNLLPMSDGSLSSPYPYFHYLAGAVLESLYRLTGGFVCGRIFMFLSLPFCTFALLAYLRNKGIKPLVACVVAGMFLVDPNLTICARWYRPDLWCMTMIFFALTLIMRSRASQHPTLLLFTSGMLAVTSLFFWITSLLLLPLVLVEFCRVHRESGDDHPPIRALPRFATVCLGGIVAAIIFLMPISQYIPEIISQYLSVSEIRTIATATDAPLSAALGRLHDFAKIACRSPFTWFTAIVGVFLSRQHLSHAILFAGLSLFIVSTRVYHLRMVYLVPYLFFFTAVAAERLVQPGNRLVASLSKTYLACALICGTVLSVGALNFAAWPEMNTLLSLEEKLKAIKLAKAPNVYLYDFEHEFYYAGRQLGWRMYSISARNQIWEKPYDAILDKMDAVIVSTMCPPLTDEMEYLLRIHGLTTKTTIDMPPSATGTIKPFLANIFYAHGYPSFTIWTRN